MFIHNDQRPDKVAEIKLIYTWLFYGTSVPFYIYTLYINVETWKGDVMFAASWILVAIHTFWTIKKNKRADYKARQEAILRDLDIEKKRREINAIRADE